MLLNELLLLRRAGKGGGGGGAAGDDLGDLVEVAGPDLALVLGGGVAVLLCVELPLLELGVGGHPAVLVVAGELEHGEVERVEPGERDELKLVAHLPELPLEGRYLLVWE